MTAATTQRKRPSAPAAPVSADRERIDDLVDHLHYVDLRLDELDALLTLTTAPDDGPLAFAQLEEAQQRLILGAIQRAVTSAREDVQTAIAAALVTRAAGEQYVVLDDDPRRA